MSYTHLSIEEHRSSEVPATLVSRDPSRNKLSDVQKKLLLLCRVHREAEVGIITYEFDGNLLVVQQVCALEYHPKGSLSNLLSDPIMHTDDIRRRGSHGLALRGS